jgi:hypothetical protein
MRKCDYFGTRILFGEVPFLVHITLSMKNNIETERFGMLEHPYWQVRLEPCKALTHSLLNVGSLWAWGCRIHSLEQLALI